MTADMTPPRPRVRAPKLLLVAATVISLALGTLSLAPAANAVSSAPSLGTAAQFALLAGTAITCTGGAIDGNVGVFPGSSVTQTGCPISGAINAGDIASGLAQLDFAQAYTAFAALPCDQTLTTLDAQILGPGVYCFEAAATSTGGVLTLNGPADGIWVFKIGTLGTGALTGTSLGVFTTGGAQARNVYWQVANAATMTDSTFIGTILAGEAITQTRGTFTGRALTNLEVTMTGTFVTGLGGN